MKRILIQTALALLIVSLLLTAPRAQQTPPAKQSPEDRVALYQALLDLTNPWTVMCIAAHPDDEDGTSLIVMRRKYGAHTVSLFSTFGEGGQNAIGPELYEEMGAIRARETMAAAEIQGSEPHFLGLKDFGYSKSADEAFKFWGHDEALRRMVLQIRKLRPDVIITNHNSTSGHGHHQATGRLELEAFDAAADPKLFPEQLKDGVTTWQVQRLFLRVGFGNRSPEQGEGTVTIDPNERDPIRGTVFAEEALRALQKHATQGPWPKTFADMLRFRNSQDGKLALTRYRLVREAKGAGALPKDSHNFLDGLRLPESVASQLALPKIDFPPSEVDGHRTQILDQLIKGFSKGNYRTPSQSPDLHRFLMIKARAEGAFALAGGVNLRVEPATKVVTPGSALDLRLSISNGGTQAVRVFDCVSARQTESPATPKPKFVMGYQELNAGRSIDRTERVTIPATARVNLPQSAHLYDGVGLGIELPVRCSIEVPGAKFDLEESARVEVGPLIEIADVSPSPLAFSSRLQRTSSFKSSTTAPPPPVEFRVRLVSHINHTIEAEVLNSRGPLSLVKVTIPADGSVSVKVAVARPVELWNIGAASHVVPDEIMLSVRLVGTRNAIATYRLRPVAFDAETAANLRVGYLRGFDHSLPNALDALGVESKELSVTDVKTADLQKYSSIIVDNRVYESQPELIAANQKLLDYANEGGTLIVFYHKSNEWNPDERRNRPQQLAPYKLVLGDARITDETAPITFLEPEHPLLNFPNKMGQEDFANWIQERGLYYPREWDPQYHALLQSNDPGEAPLKGGLLVADYGRGHYIYTSMVWYRELRGGVPGAYRMLANMISYGAAEGKSKK